MARKFPPEVEKRGRIRRRWCNHVELPRDERLNARYGLPYDNSIDKKLFPAATSYIILETKTDNEIPLLTVGVWNAINHDKKGEIVSLRKASESGQRSPLDSVQPPQDFANRIHLRSIRQETNGCGTLLCENRLAVGELT